MNVKVCSVPGCGRKHKSRGWCKHHYLKWFRFGTVDVVLKAEMTLAQRLAQKSERMPNGCLEWRGYRSLFGYGIIGFNGEVIIASRAAYEAKHGPIPPGICVCHHCDNRLCIEASHLFLGTMEDNRRDMIQKGRQNRGERHGMAKLDEKTVVEILTDPRSGKEIAAALGISRANVSQIRAGRRWSHIARSA